MTSRWKGEFEGGFSRKGAAFSRHPKPPPSGGWSIHSLEEIRAKQIGQALPLDQLTARKVPAPVTRLLCTMLAMDPGARPASARELLGLLHRCREQGSYRSARGTRPGKHLRWSISLALVAVIVAGGAFWLHRAGPPVASADRSIAVLPFENLRPDKDDASFAQGVRVEISDDLARIAALTVIESESADHYPPGKRNLAAIGRELGVWHLLEGSLRRDGGQVHIDVRLVDLRDPTHPWKKHYDRLLADVFAVQGEITHAVAARLGATLSPREEAAVDEPPTRDLKAYDLYLRASERAKVFKTVDEQMRFLRDTSIPLLEEAVTRDPKFMLAYCALASMHDQVQRDGATLPGEAQPVDHRRRAESALANARRLRPDAAEVHLAQAIHFLFEIRDNEQARIEIELARRDLPNNYNVELLAGDIARNQNRWTEAARCFERAITLDPRDLMLRLQLAYLYREMRRYDDYERVIEPIIEAETPQESATTRVFRDLAAVEQRADTAPLEATNAAVAAEEGAKHPLNRGHLALALLGRRPEALSDYLAANPQSIYHYRDVPCSKVWYDALMARMRQDRPAAQTALIAARVDADRRLQADPTNGHLLGFLAIIDAGLGNRTEAVREALQACELCPLTEAAEDAPVVASDLAVVYAWTDQPDLACNVIQEWMNRPMSLVLPLPLSYGDLQLNPLWDPLRGNPRFEALVQRLAPDPKR